MPDLADLLAAEVRRFDSASPPAFDTLVVRARRRRQRHVVGSVLGVVVVVAAAVAGPGLVRSDRGTVVPTAPSAPTAPTAPTTPTTPTTPTPSATALPVSADVYARLRLLALQMAEGNGDPHPSEMQAVAVDDVRAADGAMTGGTSSSDPVTAGYVVEIRGTFSCTGCHRIAGPPIIGAGNGGASPPSSSAPPSSSVLEATLQAGSFAAVGGGVSSRWVDLHTLGSPFSLAAASTAAPAPIVTVSPAMPSLPPATESAGPAAPDPKTLAEAEARTKAATIHPDKAAIEVAARVTAGRLRIAGLFIPAAVPDTRTMFVVVIDGQPIFPAGVDKDGTRVSRFAVIYSTGGSGLGAQAVFHGAFGLSDLPGARAAVPTVVDAGKLDTGANLVFSAAPAQTTPVSAAQAVVAAGAQSLARPLAALVYIDTVHVTHRLAWVVETDGLLLASSGPGIDAHGPRTYLATSQVVIDATTGKRLGSATFGMTQP